jgi:hypothetical protein
MCGQVVNSAQRFGVTAVQPGIGPLVGQGAVESLHLAIGLRRVRQCSISPRARFQKSAACLALVAQQLAVGQPGVTVDRDVQVVIAPDRIALPADDSAALVSVGVTPAHGTARHGTARPSPPQPPLAGILPSLLTSTWTMSPQRAGPNDRPRRSTVAWRIAASLIRRNTALSLVNHGAAQQVSLLSLV